MSKEKQLVPELRFPEFVKTGDWKEKNLIKIADKNVKWSFTGGPFGSDLKSSEYTSEGVRIIQLQNIGDGHFNNEYKIYTSEKKADELLSCNIFPGEIILSKMGDPVGRACIIPDELERAVMASDGIRLVVDENKNSKYFIYSLVNSTRIRKIILSKSTGSTRKRIGLKILKKIQLPLPNKKEQQKIADCLSSLDDLITAQNEKLEALKDHKKGLLQNLFPQEGETVPKIRFPEFEKDGEWVKSTVKDLIDLKILFAPKDGNHGSIHPKSSDYVNSGIPFVMASDLKDGKINFSTCSYLSKEQADSLRKGFAKSGDVLLSHKGTVGEVAFISETEYPYIMLTPQVTYYRIKDSSKLSNSYLLGYFTSNIFQKRLRAVSGGGTRAYIGITKQQELEIFYPKSLEEQQKIASCLSVIDELISEQIEKIKELQQHKKGLMHGLFPKVED